MQVVRRGRLRARARHAGGGGRGSRASQVPRRQSRAGHRAVRRRGGRAHASLAPGRCGAAEAQAAARWRGRAKARVAEGRGREAGAGEAPGRRRASGAHAVQGGQRRARVHHAGRGRARSGAHVAPHWRGRPGMQVVGHGRRWARAGWAAQRGGGARVHPVRGRRPEWLRSILNTWRSARNSGGSLDVGWWRSARSLDVGLLGVDLLWIGMEVGATGCGTGETERGVGSRPRSSRCGRARTVHSAAGLASQRDEG